MLAGEVVAIKTPVPQQRRGSKALQALLSRYIAAHLGTPGPIPQRERSTQKPDQCRRARTAVSGCPQPAGQTSRPQEPARPRCSPGSSPTGATASRPGTLCRVRAAAPAEPAAGLGAVTATPASNEIANGVPMGWHFRAYVLVPTRPRHRPDRDGAFDSRSQPWVQELLAALGQTLAAHGGTAGILRDHAPASLNTWPA